MIKANNWDGMRTILVQTDDEAVHLTTEVLQAIMQSCPIRDCQEVVNIVIQVNQTESHTQSSATLPSSVTKDVTSSATSVCDETVKESRSCEEPEPGTMADAAKFPDCYVSCHPGTYDGANPSNEIETSLGETNFKENIDATARSSVCITGSLTQFGSGGMPVTGLRTADMDQMNDELTQCSEKCDGSGQSGERPEYSFTENKAFEEHGTHQSSVCAENGFLMSDNAKRASYEETLADYLETADNYELVSDYHLLSAGTDHDEISDESKSSIKGDEMKNSAWNCDKDVCITANGTSSSKDCPRSHTLDRKTLVNSSQQILGRTAGSVTDDVKATKSGLSAWQVVTDQTCSKALTGTNDVVGIDSNEDRAMIHERTNVDKTVNKVSQLHFVTCRQGSFVDKTNDKKVWRISYEKSKNKVETPHMEHGDKILDVIKGKSENKDKKCSVSDAKHEDKYKCEKGNLESGNKFACDECGKVFDRKFNLERHLRSKRVHRKPTKKKYTPRPAKCDVCGKMFHSVSAMCMHRRKHDDSQRYDCPHCGRRFTQKGNLRIHIKTIHDGLRELICEQCGKQFASSASLTYHNQRVHLEEEMKLRYLQLSYVRNQGQCNAVKKEQVPKVQILGEVTYDCPLCSHTFRKVFGWFAHLNLHTLFDGEDDGIKQRAASIIKELQGPNNVFKDIVLFPCTVCDYVAFCQSDVIIHLNRHSKDKPFSCERCGQMFASASERTNHEQYHTKKFRHPCHVCDSGFPLLSQLKLHLMKEHQVSIEKLPGSKGSRCETCGKEFIYKTLLKKHIRNAHEGLKNFQCELCGKAFKTKYSAEIHLRRHTNDCRYKCQTCDKPFIDPSNLIHHMKRVHKQVSSSKDHHSLHQSCVK